MEIKRRLIPGTVIGAIVAVAGVVLWLSPPGSWLEEQIGLKWLFSVRGPVEAPADVVVVSIDRRSAVALGHDPGLAIWPREVHAELVRTLAELGAATIAFDIAFRDEGNSRTDAELADAIVQSGQVVLIEWLEEKQGYITDEAGEITGTVEIEIRTPPLNLFAQAAAGLGPFPLPKEGTAPVSQVWMFKPAAGGIATLPAMTLRVRNRNALAMWHQALEAAGTSPADQTEFTKATYVGSGPSMAADSLHADMVATRAMFMRDPGLADRVRKHLVAHGAGLPSYDHAALMALASLYGSADSRFLNFYGPPGTIRTLPIHALIDGDTGGPREAGLSLEGRTVFVGASEMHDAGQPDGFPTVFTRRDGVDLSGVEIAATAFANLIDNRLLVVPGPGVVVAALVVFGLVIGLIVSLLPPKAVVPGGLLFGAGYAATAYVLFASAHIWLPITTPLAWQLPLAVIFGQLGKIISFTKILAKLFPRWPGGNPENLQTYSRVINAVCLKTDAENFTHASEIVGPHEIQKLLSIYLGKQIEASDQHLVDICEIGTDGLLAAWDEAKWGPLESRRRACLAALDTVAAVDRFNKDHPEYPSMPARIGLTSGEIFYGNKNIANKIQFGVYGDPANLASRLESLNKVLGTRILVSADAVAGVDAVRLRPVGVFMLRGVTEPVSVVEVRCRRSDDSAGEIELCERFAEALALFQGRDFVNAAESLDALLTDFPQDGPTAYLRRQCASPTDIVPDYG